MKTTPTNATLLFYPQQNPHLRHFALWYFTVLLIVWNGLGHTVLGFEQSWATPFAAVAAALLMQFGLRWVDRVARHQPAGQGAGGTSWVQVLPTALIPGFACGMLLYPNERLWPVIFAASLSIASKVLIRVPVGPGRTQHVFNPSNFGIAVTLVLFPEVGFAPPYHFTENITGAWHWLIPGFILASGIFVHARFTGRLPLCGAWIVGFVAQGIIRAHFSGTPLFVPLMPMSSAAFIVFTLYMIPDPATTPLRPWPQVAFGLGVAVTYGVIQWAHGVFGLFFALVTVCAVRGLALAFVHFRQARFLCRPRGAQSGVGVSPAGPWRVVASRKVARI